jgi:uncharacterized protein YjcR
METRERVLALLKEGLNNAEIARRLEISKVMVGKHKAKLIEEGRWQEPTEAAPKAKEGKGKAAQSAPSSEPPPKAKTDRRKPPPPGPHSTGFKPGNPGGPGAPPGNDFAVRHGAHQTIFAGALDPEELAIYLAVDTGVAAQLEEEIRLLTIRELRMMNRIHKLRQAGDMTIVEQTEEEQGAGEEDEGKPKAKSKRSWKSLGTLGQIQSIEAELTKVQEKKARLIAVKIDAEKGKPPEDENQDTFMAALNATAEEVWGTQEDTERAEGDG